jgi:hypothetical protein
LPIVDFRVTIEILSPDWRWQIQQSAMLLGLFMTGMFAATATELTELKPVRRGFLVLGRYVVAALTVVTLEHNVVAWHLFLSGRPLQPAKGRLTRFLILNRQSAIGNRRSPLFHYFANRAGSHRASTLANGEP